VRIKNPEARDAEYVQGSVVPLTLLILGGYGTFGGRLARLLADEPRLHLVIAGRSLAKAEAFCRKLPAGAARTPLALDRNGDLDAALEAVAPDVLVDASGPFQAYGERPYRVAQACIARGIDYLDLADGSDFVVGIAALDSAAKAKGAGVLSGVSSVPALSGAVVRRLAQGMRRVEAIRGGIAPSPHARVGLNVVRALAGYAGRPVALTRDGATGEGRALTETLRYDVSLSGHRPLGPRLFSLVDVPDLRLLPAEWPGVKSVWFGAAPTPEAFHRAFIAMAWLVRIGLVPTLEPLAGLFHAAINAFAWGAHRGGMFMEVEGVDDDGRRLRRSWRLIAEGDDGPFIPSMAAEALVRRRLAGRRPPPGARSAINELELEDFAPAFARRRIFTGLEGDL
jgi:saccharopine dehydrogenase-like NADP-dependent oxidoreductase